MNATAENNSNKSLITGTIMQLIVLLITSPVFTDTYSDNVMLYAIFVAIITISNIVIEMFSISKKGNNSQQYMGLFLAITLPINIVLIILFQLLTS